MSMTTKATPEDWAACREAWATGLSFDGCAALIHKRASAASIRRRAKAEAWERADGFVANGTIEERRAASEAARIETGMAYERRKAELTDALVSDVFRMRDELFSPYTVKEAKVVSGGKDMGASVEIVDIELTRPSPADQQRIATTMAILTDKLLLLAGEATSRTENLNDNRESAVERAKALTAEARGRLAAVPDLPDAAEAATG